jgi:hypothetical protein
MLQAPEQAKRQKCVLAARNEAAIRSGYRPPSALVIRSLAEIGGNAGRFCGEA